MNEDNIQQLDPAKAWEKLQQGDAAVLIDVRCKVEFDFVGHPPEAIHVPWAESPHWQPDPEFTQKVRQKLTEIGYADRPALLVMCRSGQRSLIACHALAAAGFSDIANIDEGFEGDKDDAGHRSTINGWRFRGLPWEQT